MTTPQNPDPDQQPGAYPPPPEAGQPSAYPAPGAGADGGYPPPGQPGAYPAPPGQPSAAYPPPPGAPGAPGAPAPQEKKSNLLRIILSAVVVVAVVLGVVLYFVNRQADPSTAAVGDCVKVNSVSTSDADVDKVDCGDPNAAYKVTASGGAGVTCDTREARYTESTKDDKTSTTLCLQPNVTAGDCFKIPESDDAPAAKVDCGSSKGDSEVVKILAIDHATSDDSACPDGTAYTVSYTVHKGVLCLAENG